MYLFIVLPRTLFLSCFASRLLWQIPGPRSGFDSPAFAPSMNPTPVEEWLRNYCVRLCGAVPTTPVEQILLRNPAHLVHQPLNPVEKPNGVNFPFWFDSACTPSGQRLSARLGENSGFFQEYLNWAPVVSWLFDVVAAQCQLLIHPQTPPVFRKAWFPYFHALASVLELASSLLQVHSVHAQHHGTPLDGT